MLLYVDGRHDTCWYSVWCICMSINCEKCSIEMQQLTQGMTDYQWYKDYYCPVCKRTVVKLDKSQKTNAQRLTERMF
mgnify:CR=1 FL=1